MFFNRGCFCCFTELLRDGVPLTDSVGHPYKVLVEGLKAYRTINSAKASRILTGLNWLASGTNGYARSQVLKSLLIGDMTGFRTLALNRFGSGAGSSQRLNPSQVGALTQALSTVPVTSVEAPPGSGKTTFLIEMINQIGPGTFAALIVPTNQLCDDAEILG